MPEVQPPFQVDEFLREIYYTPSKSKGIKLVYETMDRVLGELFMKDIDDVVRSVSDQTITGKKSKNPNFEVVDKILEYADPWKMEDSVTIAFLVTTHKSKANLSKYKPFMKRVRKHFHENHNEKETEDLLRGFE